MTLTKLTFLLPAVLLLALLSGCSDSGAIPVADEGDNMEVVPVSFATQIEPVLHNSCGAVPCHGLATSSGFSVADYSSITGSADHGVVVVPGFADSSNLYLKLLDPPPFGARMPENGPPYLPDSTINLIRDWINQGAEDN